MTIKLDRAGVRQVLKSSGVRTVMHSTASRVARDVSGQEPEADVVVDDYTTDRAASSVTVREAQARLWQARDGLLTKAASRQGLEVTER